MIDQSSLQRPPHGKLRQPTAERVYRRFKYGELAAAASRYTQHPDIFPRTAHLGAVCAHLAAGLRPHRRESVAFVRLHPQARCSDARGELSSSEAKLKIPADLSFASQIIDSVPAWMRDGGPTEGLPPAASWVRTTFVISSAHKVLVSPCPFMRLHDAEADARPPADPSPTFPSSLAPGQHLRAVAPEGIGRLTHHLTRRSKSWRRSSVDSTSAFSLPLCSAKLIFSADLLITHRSIISAPPPA